MSAIQQLQRAIDWYDRICQQLNDLKIRAHKYQDEGEVLPSDNMFEFVKMQIEDIRRLADFPTIPPADVWLGPEGQIGITLEFDNESIELIFSNEHSITARHINELEQTLIEKKDIPITLKRLAA